MIRPVFLLLITLLVLPFAQAEERVTLDLNGTWQFDQTETAFPPDEFTREIPVPGLIHLAQPKIEQSDTLLTADYQPRYNWYRRTFRVPEDLQGTYATVTLKKSMYVTQVFVNGMDLGTSMACYTPIELPVPASALRYGQDNEILVRVGDRAWLPSPAAGSTDKEKIAYLPGIWDDVSVSFTGGFRCQNALLLPNIKTETVTAKIRVRSFYPAQIRYGDPMKDTCRLEVRIKESSSGRWVTEPIAQDFTAKRDNLTVCELEIPMKGATLWSPDNPFLYTAVITVLEGDKVSDTWQDRFGMREFHRNGKHFTLNGKEIILRGTNITLHRFFEDPECAELPWNREWVTRLMKDIPQALQWNAMRVCVGIAPDFWYDIADEAGLLLQNEWLYWQNHGWDEQIRSEYTDWVWADGNHPSIAIWDAINENWDEFIGNVLIPDLKKLDPTRLWDAGYMTSEHMALDEMDEPHPYRTLSIDNPNFDQEMDKNPFRIGDLNDWPARWREAINSSAAQLVNEYAWMWLWRDGRPAKLTERNYAYYLGEGASNEDRLALQAYWWQLETEWLRAERSLAGVLAFCYLANNYGFTGDWFLDPIRDLKPNPTLLWFAHVFAPAAVFIDVADERYTKNATPHQPGSWFTFNVAGVNDFERPVQGEVTVKLIDAEGGSTEGRTFPITIPAYGKQYAPVSVRLPEEPGGYLLLAEFRSDANKKSPVLSRRFLKVGAPDSYKYFELKPEGF